MTNKELPMENTIFHGGAFDKHADCSLDDQKRSGNCRWFSGQLHTFTSSPRVSRLRTVGARPSPHGALGSSVWPVPPSPVLLSMCCLLCSHDFTCNHEHSLSRLRLPPWEALVTRLFLPAGARCCPVMVGFMCQPDWAKGCPRVLEQQYFWVCL